ncbi:hypothetical protein [Deinococcus sp. Leaf326]|uniref:XkdW family protein n=1 Tax=Deinococcus sp. Leaf326 TaxID=1736338 RepID=UPI0006FD44FA|nr:hypothetical protein [Deinococcus sp. Leaf326]KQR40733.1 hypothetical protein ASF71_00770 [Deinococcus sp. Leaf326]
MIDYIPTPEPVREVYSTLPEGRALTPEQAQALRWLYPGAALLQVGEVVYVTAWTLPIPQPTDAELEAALPAAQAHAADRVEMDEIGAELFERYTLHARALALGKVSTAKEIEEEATSLLAYQQEIRDRAPTSPS